MKIDKLRTQIQFEKYLDSLTDSEFCELENDEIWEYNELEIDGLRWHCAKSHIKHLERTLTKEMFVNNESQDWVNEDGSINVKIQLNWMEAEKKVIFEGFELKNNSINYKDVIHIFWFDTITQLWKLSNGMNKINDLALLMRSGQLKLKNIEI